MIKKLLIGALAMASLEAYANSIAGTWQGPCETRGELSVKFTYVIEDTGENTGNIAKTKIYYDDAACSVYNHTGRQTVSFVIGEADEFGVYPLDVTHRGNVLYDIVALSEDGNTLTFGERYSRDPAERPTTLSTTNRVFVRVAN